MLRKTMIVLATAAALTGGLTADAFARGGGGGGGVDTVAVSAVALIWGAEVVAALCAILLLSWDHRPRRCPPLKTGFRPHSRHPRRHPSSTGRCHSPRSGA